MLRRTLLAAAAMLAIASPSLAQDRLECQLRGDDYPRGGNVTWWIDGDTLQQGPVGSAILAIPAGKAWMKILFRDETRILATWNFIEKGVWHRFEVDLVHETVEETSGTDRATDTRRNVGTCRLVIADEA